MKRPEEVKLEFTRKWVRKAEDDFQVACNLSEGDGVHFYAATFHAQQSAEKYLKAFLVWHQIEFTKTHDIKVLLDLAGRMDSTLPDALKDAVMLTPYGVEYRYPGDYPEVQHADVQQAVECARRVREEILKRLPCQAGETGTHFNS